jgi:hypothetical protein
LRTHSRQAGTHTVMTKLPGSSLGPAPALQAYTCCCCRVLQEDADDILADNAEDLGGEDLGGSAAHYRYTHRCLHPGYGTCALLMADHVKHTTTGEYQQLTVNT